jgi:hypothetical protein
VPGHRRGEAALGEVEDHALAGTHRA